MLKYSFRCRPFFPLALVLLSGSVAVFSAVRLATAPETSAPGSKSQPPIQPAPRSWHRRSMIAFSTFNEPNELRRRGWYAVWCYLPQARKRTVHHWQRSATVAERIANLSRAGRAGQEWAIINGGYFDYNTTSQERMALIGSVGNGRDGRWSHGAPPANRGKYFQRWAFGFRSAYNGNGDFSLALMQRHKSARGFVVPPALESEYSYGMSGLLGLIQNGKTLAWRDGRGRIQLTPTRQWGGSTEFRDGYYRRAAIGWTSDGRHLFMVVHHHPRSVLETRDLFGVYRGRDYVRPGILLAQLRKEFSRLSPQERPCKTEQLPMSIDNAVLLDGGHSASLFYRHIGPDGRKQGNRLTPVPGSMARSGVRKSRVWPQPLKSGKQVRLQPFRAPAAATRGLSWLWEYVARRHEHQ